MNTRIMYIENNDHEVHRGEAWIGKVEFSKSGKTIYFNGLALRKMTGTACANTFGSNYFSLVEGGYYWVSGVKKNGQDRHWAGGGRIKIDRTIVDEYLALVDFDKIDETNFELVDILPTDKLKFAAIEHEKL